jgi:hypothetical protein
LLELPTALQVWHSMRQVYTATRISDFTQTVCNSTGILNAVLKGCTLISVLLHANTFNWTRLYTHINLLANMHIVSYQLWENGSCSYILVPQSTTLCRCMRSRH